MSAQAPAQSVDVQSSGRLSVRFNGRAVALLLIALAVVLLAIPPLRGYLDERGQLKDLQNQATVLERQNRSLQTQIDQLSDPAFLERIARMPGHGQAGRDRVRCRPRARQARSARLLGRANITDPSRHAYRPATPPCHASVRG